jgi:PKD repeat protein
MRLLSLLVLSVSPSRLALPAVLIATAFVSSCDKVPLLAPTESTITITVSTTTVPVNGTATLLASVTEAAGTPVHNGTQVTFTSSFGTVDPAEARTDGGVATARFLAGTLSGTATIGAFSGAARAETVEIRVGGAAAAAVVVRADPQAISAAGGTSEIVATVLDDSGNPLAGVPVTFTTTAGQLNPGQSTTGANGEARSTLTAPRTATVTARAGAQTATVEVLASSPAVTIAVPTTGIEAGIAATFTITPVTGGNGIRDVSLDWGDGTTPTRLGAIAGATTAVHTYARAGVYTITATVTDTQGIVGTSSNVVNVIAQSSIPVTLSATPNPVSVSSAAQQGLVTFQAQAGALGGAGATITSYSWDFGDGGGTQTTGASTNHRYTAPGTYSASVTVRSTTGQQGLATLTVRVNP